MKAFRVGLALLLLSLAPPLRAGEDRKADARTFQVPYQMTAAQHVLVRAKINGKGPYNFIIDTGAPALFVAPAVAEKLGVKPDKKGWATLDRFEIEGGIVIPKAQGRVEAVPQLEGMNSMGLAGAELHGVIGYTLLAKYRLTFDFTKDRMTWTELKDFDPPAPEGLGGKGGPAELNALAGVMKLLGGLLGKPSPPVVAPRGFLGLELADGEKGVAVKNAIGPAAVAGVKAGDRITEFEGQAVKTAEEIQKLAAKISVGTSVKVKVERGGASQAITVKAGEGL
jgi:hypothetical protein